MAGERRLALWAVVSLVAAALVVTLLSWLLVFSPAARLRQADRLLACYRASPDAEIARRLAHLLGIGLLPNANVEEILRALLTPAQVARGRLNGGKWSDIEIRFPHGGLEFEGLRLDCRAYIRIVRGGTVHVVPSVAPRALPRVPDVLRLEMEQTALLPFQAGPHPAKLYIFFEGSHEQEKPTRERVTHFLKDVEMLALDDDPFDVAPRFYYVRLEVPFEFDVAEPCNAGEDE